MSHLDLLSFALLIWCETRFFLRMAELVVVPPHQSMLFLTLCDKTFPAKPTARTLGEVDQGPNRRKLPGIAGSGECVHFLQAQQVSRFPGFFTRAIDASL